MARAARTYRKVEPDMWMSDDFRALSAPPPNAQTLWQYLLTGPRTIAIPGVVVARPAVMADDLRWSRRGFDKAMAEIVAAGMAEVDPDAGLVVLTKALIRDGRARDTAHPQSPNAVKAWVIALSKLPACALRDVVAARIERLMSLIGGAFPIHFAGAMAESCTKLGAIHAPSNAQVIPHSGNREQVTEIPEVSPAGARDPGAPAPEPEHQLAAGTLPATPPVATEPEGRGSDQFVQLAADARSRVTNVLHALMGELGKPMFPAGQQARRLSELELEQLTVSAVAGWVMSEPDRDPAAVVGARVEHLIAVRSAVARERRNVSWWAQATFWNPDHLERDLLQTPEDAVRSLRASSRGRDGPAGRQPRADRGQAAVSTTAQRFDGDVPL